MTHPDYAVLIPGVAPKPVKLMQLSLATILTEKTKSRRGRV